MILKWQPLEAINTSFLRHFASFPCKAWRWYVLLKGSRRDLLGWGDKSVLLVPCRFCRGPKSSSGRLCVCVSLCLYRYLCSSLSPVVSVSGRLCICVSVSVSLSLFLSLSLSLFLLLLLFLFFSIYISVSVSVFCLGLSVLVYIVVSVSRHHHHRHHPVSYTQLTLPTNREV